MPVPLPARSSRRRPGASDAVGVTVSPETFRFVEFDAELIRQIASELSEALGLGGHDLRVEVDETTPLTRVRTSIDGGTITVRAESGAFEDTRRPRRQSEANTRLALGRALLRVRDRLSGDFDDAPADADLTLAQVAAWQAYCVGRLERLGHPQHQQRWRYDFRNRHGFSDVADAVFDRLWSSSHLTWAELDALSRSAMSDAA